MLFVYVLYLILQILICHIINYHHFLYCYYRGLLPVYMDINKQRVLLRDRYTKNNFTNKFTFVFKMLQQLSTLTYRQDRREREFNKSLPHLLTKKKIY